MVLPVQFELQDWLVRREKAAIFSGCDSHPVAFAPCSDDGPYYTERRRPGSNRFDGEIETAMSDEESDFVRVVIPMLVCRDAASEIDFCKAAFGAVELSRRAVADGTVVHATLTIGEALIFVHAEVPTLGSRPPQADGSSSVVIYVYLEDPDIAIDRAVAAGARVLVPVTNTFWGDRVGRIIDPSGHVWNVATRTKGKL